MNLESKEKIRKHITVQEVEKKDAKALNDLKIIKKKYLFKLFLIILFFLIVLSVGILIIFFYTKKSKTKSTIINPDKEIIKPDSESLESIKEKLFTEKNNSIKAVYSVKKGEEYVFFNPEFSSLLDK